MIRLSIVIPVYNVEQYIARCLDSCLSQDIPSDEYEIIVVNDGTPDSSMAIVDNYCRKYQNIRIINRENGGQAAARNTGLKQAKGKYIWFVDGDDRIATKCINGLIKIIERDSLDVLGIGFKLEYPDGRVCDCPYNEGHSGKIYSGYEFVCKVKMPHGPWGAIFSRIFLENNGLFFIEGIIHEDFEYTSRAYSLAERIEVINNPIYYYLQREGGTMKSQQNARRCRDFIKIADSLYNFAHEKFEKGSEPYKELMRRVYFSVFQSLAYYSSDVLPLSTYKQKRYFPMDASMGNGTMGMKIRLINISLRLYILIHRCLKK